MDESFQRFHAERKLARSKRTLSPQPAVLEAFEIFRESVIWAIDDSQVLAATDFYGWLRQSFASFIHEVPGLHNHSFASRGSQLLPPAGALLVLP